MTDPRAELRRERVKVAAWTEGQHADLAFFGPRYVIWLIDKALEAVRESDTRIAQLTAENDQLNSREVIMVPDGHCLEVQAMPGVYAEGTIMREMGTGREWVFSDGRWETSGR